MNHHFSFKASLLLSGLMFLPPAWAADMSETDYAAAKTRIAADYKLDLTACESVVGNARDICNEQAEGKQKVALAELDYGQSASAGNRSQLMMAKADAAFAVAKERCDDVADRYDAKDVCVRQAEATHTSALADAKMGK